MESDDSDSTDTDNSIVFIETIEASNEEKQELILTISQNDRLVGYINAIVINAGLLKQDLSIDDKLKCKNKEDEDEIILFYNSLKDTLYTNIIFYITDFFLEKPYRSKGLGGLILKELPLWLTIHHPEIDELYLFPYPLEKNNGKVECVANIDPQKLLEMRNHLISFYINNGLQKTSTQFLKMPIHYNSAIEYYI